MTSPIREKAFLSYYNPSEEEEFQCAICRGENTDEPIVGHLNIFASNEADAGKMVHLLHKKCYKECYEKFPENLKGKCGCCLTNLDDRQIFNRLEFLQIQRKMNPVDKSIENFMIPFTFLMGLIFFIQLEKNDDFFIQLQESYEDHGLTIFYPYIFFALFMNILWFFPSVLICHNTFIQEGFSKALVPIFWSSMVYQDFPSVFTSAKIIFCSALVTTVFLSVIPRSLSGLTSLVRRYI